MRTDTCSNGIFLFLFLTSFFNQANALDVAGSITADTTWGIAGSPYVVTGDVIVNENVILTIEAGVTVKFNVNTALGINGTLIARGVPGNIITFTSSNADERWRHISFDDSTAGAVSGDAVFDDVTGVYQSGSIIEYALIENAGNQTTVIKGVVEFTSKHPYLNNLTIQNNTAGGVFGETLSSLLKIKNSVITENSNPFSGALGGGGVFLQGSSGSEIELTGNTIQFNTTVLKGGGINVSAHSAASSFSSVIIENNIISENQANSGGGLFVNGGTGSQVTVTGNTIQNNNAILNGGGLSIQDRSIDAVIGAMQIDNNIVSGNQSNANGGGVYITGMFGSNSQNIIMNNTIKNNIAVTQGGGVWINYSEFTLSNNVILGNDAKVGGGIYIGGYGALDSIIFKNSISGNRAFDNGGGLYIDNGKISVDSNIIYYNQATNPTSAHGGGIDLHHILESSEVITISNNVIADNSSFKDVLNLGGAISMTGNAILRNTVNATNKGTIIFGPTLTNLSNNTLVGNSVPGGLAFIENLNLVTPNANSNNIFNNTANLIFVTQSANLNADSNWWGTTIDADILNMVSANPNATITVATPQPEPITTVPISPPSGVNLVSTNSEITLTWDVNPEVDVSGYNVYWGTSPVPDFKNDPLAVNPVKIIGRNTTTHTLSELTQGVYYVAVTAFDSAAGQGANVDTTFVNEDQTSGVESWFSLQQIVSTFSADLGVTVISDVTGTVFAGDQVIYTVTVINNGPVDAANNIVMTSVLPDGAGFVSASNGCAEISGIVTCTLASLAATTPGNIATFDIEITAPGTGGLQTNSVSVNSADVDSNAANDTGSVDVTVVAMADLGVEVEIADDLPVIVPGDVFTYKITVTNNGPSIANNIILQSTLPGGVIFDSSSLCIEDAGLITCSIATLNSKPADKSVIFRINVIAAPSIVGPVSSLFAVSADEADNLNINDTASIDTIVVGDADLGVAISADGSVTVGGSINYSVTVTNNGPNAVSNAVVEATLPSGSVFVSASDTCSENGSIVTCIVPTLDITAPNNTALFSFIVTAPTTAGSSTSTATVTTVGNDSVSSNNVASVETTVNAKSGGSGGGVFGPLIIIIAGWIYVFMLRKRKATY